MGNAKGRGTLNLSEGLRNTQNISVRKDSMDDGIITVYMRLRKRNTIHHNTTLRPASGRLRGCQFHLFNRMKQFPVSAGKKL
jgi:hypothetical protein